MFFLIANLHAESWVSFCWKSHLANRTASSRISCWHDNVVSVCPSVILCIVAKWYILQQKCLNKWIGSALWEHDFADFSPLPCPLELLTLWTIDVGAIRQIHWKLTVNKWTAYSRHSKRVNFWALLLWSTSYRLFAVYCDVVHWPTPFVPFTFAIDQKSEWMNKWIRTFI